MPTPSPRCAPLHVFVLAATVVDRAAIPATTAATHIYHLQPGQLPARTVNVIVIERRIIIVAAHRFNNAQAEQPLREPPRAARVDVDEDGETKREAARGNDGEEERQRDEAQRIDAGESPGEAALAARARHRVAFVPHDAPRLIPRVVALDREDEDDEARENEASYHPEHRRGRRQPWHQVFRVCDSVAAPHHVPTLRTFDDVSPPVRSLTPHSRSSRPHARDRPNDLPHEILIGSYNWDRIKNDLIGEFFTRIVLLEMKTPLQC